MHARDAVYILNLEPEDACIYLFMHMTCRSTRTERERTYTCMGSPSHMHR